MAPGKTPEATLDLWNRELAKVLLSPEVRDQLTAHGLIPAPSSRQELRRQDHRGVTSSAESKQPNWMNYE